MSPLEVSISTSAPRVAGARIAMSPEPGLDASERDVPPELGGDAAAAGLE